MHELLRCAADLLAAHVAGALTPLMLLSCFRCRHRSVQTVASTGDLCSLVRHGERACRVDYRVAGVAEQRLVVVTPDLRRRPANSAGMLIRIPRQCHFQVHRDGDTAGLLYVFGRSTDGRDRNSEACR